MKLSEVDWVFEHFSQDTYCPETMIKAMWKDHVVKVWFFNTAWLEKLTLAEWEQMAEGWVWSVCYEMTDRILKNLWDEVFQQVSKG